MKQLLESRCPICQPEGNNYHECPENIKVCDACQLVLMPDLYDEQFTFDHPSIADYSGFISL